jgi:hypothetical protein
MPGGVGGRGIKTPFLSLLKPSPHVVFVGIVDDDIGKIARVQGKRNIYNSRRFAMA